MDFVSDVMSVQTFWRILLFIHFTLAVALLGAVTLQAVAALIPVHQSIRMEHGSYSIAKRPFERTVVVLRHRRPVLERQMFCERVAAVLLMTLALCSAGKGQTAPAPGLRERELALIIRQAGYDCVFVESIAGPPDPPPGWEGLRPEIATCTDGKRYLIAKSGRSGGNVRPVVRPMF